MASLSRVIEAFADQAEARAADMLAALDEDERRQVLEALTDEERAFWWPMDVCWRTTHSTINPMAKE